MKTGKILIKTVAATLIAASISATILSQTASAEQANKGVTLKPGSGMSFIVGSKKALTYFLKSAGQCDVTILVSEAKPVVDSAYHSASRVKVQLIPGKSTQIDSAEGKSLNVVCNQDAKSVTIYNQPLKLSALY